MRHGIKSDYTAPFQDVSGETAGESVKRVVAIGIGPLLEWWGRVKHDTSPGTFGATGHELASSVAYIVAGGQVARRFANESAPHHKAARQLGAEINWV